MSTTVTFDLASDDETFMEQVNAVKGDDVMTWRLAVFVAQLQLEKALKAQTIREHYDTIHMRARATRKARMEAKS